MKFTMEFAADNAAFGESEDERALEIALILRTVLDEVENQSLDRPHPVYDSNGNKIGQWVLSP